MISPYIIPGLKVNRKSLKDLSFEKIYPVVLNTICERYNVTRTRLGGIFREADIVYIRGLYCYWMRENLGSKATLARIAKTLNRNHGTVMNSVLAFEKRIEQNQLLPEKIRHICQHTMTDYTFMNEEIKSQCLLVLTGALGRGKTH